MRADGPDGQRWRVGRRWLPWRPRLHAVAAAIHRDASDGGLGLFDAVLEFVGFLLFVAAAALTAVEWLLLLALLPMALPVRLLGGGRVVAARGRLADGARLRCERRAEPGAAVELRDAAVAEIRADGEPRSLGPIIVVREPRPESVSITIDARTIASLNRGGSSTFEAAVFGLTGACWVDGDLTRTGDRLTFAPDGADAEPLPVPPAASVTLRPATDADGRRAADRLVADYQSGDGRTIRIAVVPHLGPVLQAALASTSPHQL